MKVIYAVVSKGQLHNLPELFEGREEAYLHALDLNLSVTTNGNRSPEYQVIELIVTPSLTESVPFDPSNGCRCKVKCKNCERED